MKSVNTIIKAYEELKTRRQPYEGAWDDISDLVVPYRPKFLETGEDFTPDTERYESSGVRANEYLAATLLNGLISQDTNWFRLAFEDPDLAKDDLAKRIAEKHSQAIYDLFNSASSGFYPNMGEVFTDLPAYGTAGLEIYYVPGEGIKFTAIHLSQLYIASDKSGFIDTVYRKFTYTARQAAQMWGAEALSKEMQKALDETPHKKFEIVRCCKPEESYFKKKRSQHAYYSAYIEVENEHMISEGGLKHFPYVIPRWAKRTCSDYGTSPAWIALPDLIQLQDMRATLSRVSQMAGDPHMLMANDGVMIPHTPEPGGSTFGGIDPERGFPLMRPLDTNADIGAIMNMMDVVSRDVQKAFYNNSLGAQDLPQMTAEEAAIRRDEELRVIGPNANRIIQEALNPLIILTYNLMKENDLLPKEPPEIEEVLKDEAFKIHMTSPLSRTAKLVDEGAKLRWMNNTYIPLVQLQPEVADHFNAAEYLKDSVDNLGVTMDIINPPQVVEAIQAQRAEQEEAQRAMELAAQADQAEANAPEGAVEDDGEI